MKIISVICLVFLFFIQDSFLAKKQPKRKLRKKRHWADGSAPMPKDRHYRRKRTRFRPEQFKYILDKYAEEEVVYEEIPDPILRNPQSNENECDLQVELFPLYYTPILKSLNFRMGFSSSCMQKRDLTFEIYFKGNHQVNYNYHPKTITMDIFGNQYTIHYDTPVPRDIFDIMRSLEYTTAKFLPLFDRNEFDVKNRNEIYLFPQIDNTFTAYNIMKIQQAKLIICEVEGGDDRKLNLNDYEIRAPKQKVFNDDDDDRTKEQKVLDAEIAKIKKVQGLKKAQFESDLGVHELKIICKIQ